MEGGAGKKRWICENKWWASRKAGRAEVESLIRNGSVVKKEVGMSSNVFALRRKEKK